MVVAMRLEPEHLASLARRARELDEMVEDGEMVLGDWTERVLDECEVWCSCCGDAQFVHVEPAGHFCPVCDLDLRASGGGGGDGSEDEESG